MPKKPLREEHYKLIYSTIKKNGRVINTKKYAFDIN